MNAPLQAAETPTDLPGDSIYLLDLGLVDQDSRASKLSDLRGRPVLIAMFYTSCKYACPLVIDTLKSTAKALPDDARARLRIVLVSFDPQRDTPAVLKAVSAERHIDLAHWTLARTDEAGVRELAAVLDVHYRAVMNGDFNHSSTITLLDEQGRIAAHSDRLGEPDPDLVASVRRIIAAAP
ncbi:MAG: SCO family protein [Rudaea sp.]